MPRPETLNPKPETLNGKQALHLIALSISAADQDKETGDLGGRVWEQLAVNACAEGTRGKARRRSVVESLVLLQNPAQARAGSQAFPGRSQQCRFQRELHEAFVLAILQKLSKANAKCSDLRSSLARGARAGNEAGAAGEGEGAGGGSGKGGGEDEKGAEEWKRRQAEAKERMMQAMKEQQAQALAAMMMDMSDDDEDLDDGGAQPAAAAGHAMDCADSAAGEPATEGAGKLFLEADEAMPTQCVLCHEGGSCTGKGAKPLGIIAFIQPSTVLSVVARRQRQAELDRIAANRAHQSMGDDAPASSSASFAAAASPLPAPAGGGAGSPLEVPRGLERGFVCGHQMMAEASVAGWEGVVSGTSAGADRDAAATGAAVSFCGHGMHADCLHRFLDTQRGSYAEYGAVLSEREFMCPLCRSLANTLVPLSSLSAPSPAVDSQSAPATCVPCTSMVKAAAFGPGGWGGGGGGG